MSSSDLPTISGRQAREVDRLAEERFGIPVDWLMEAAGWQIAKCAGSRAAVVCGVGNNAGDGLAAARHLHRWGRLASVSCIDAGKLRGPAARELEALRRLGVAITDDLHLGDAEMIVDAIFGTGLSRAPEGRYADWIEAVDASDMQVLAVDVPSGLDADTGLAYAPAVHADVTISLGLPKPGVSGLSRHAFLVDIGVPLAAYAAVGVEVPPGLFAKGDVISLW